MAGLPSFGPGTVISTPDGTIISGLSGDFPAVAATTPSGSSPTQSPVGGLPAPLEVPSPEVGSPLGRGDSLDLSADLLQRLLSAGSADLMLTDDVGKDDLWQSLFGGPPPAPLHSGSGGGLGDEGLLSDAAPLKME